MLAACLLLCFWKYWLTCIICKNNAALTMEKLTRTIFFAIKHVSLSLSFPFDYFCVAGEAICEEASVQ